MWLFLDNLPALFSKTNSRINIKHLTVALSYGFHCTWKQLFNIHFLSAIFEEVGEISAWSMWRWCLVWCGTVVCDLSSCIGVARSFVHSFYSSVHSSVSPGRSGEEKKDFLSPPPHEKKSDQHLVSSLQNINISLCVLFHINNHHCVHLSRTHSPSSNTVRNHSTSII